MNPAGIYREVVVMPGCSLVVSATGTMAGVRFNGSMISFAFTLQRWAVGCKDCIRINVEGVKKI